MGFSFFNMKKPVIVGILNVTPDSFYDGGRYILPEEAALHAMEIEKEGAHIIDIGAVSTRPSSVMADESTEKDRLFPALEAILSSVCVPVSIDTFRPAVAKAALEMGAKIINDVSGWFNESMAEVVKDYSAGWILTHTGGRGVGAGESVDYPGGVTASVQQFFDDAVIKATAFGILPDSLCLDPGFGFSKNSDENIRLLNSLGELKTHSCSMMCALSRKRFIADYASEIGLSGLLAGTLAADMQAYEQGADLFRVHDVAEHIRMFNNK